jgi:hypothetical protein
VPAKIFCDISSNDWRKMATVDQGDCENTHVQAALVLKEEIAHCYTAKAARGACAQAIEGAKSKESRIVRRRSRSHRSGNGQN